MQEKVGTNNIVPKSKNRNSFGPRLSEENIVVTYLFRTLVCCFVFNDF